MRHSTFSFSTFQVLLFSFLHQIELVMSSWQLYVGLCWRNTHLLPSLQLFARSLISTTHGVRVVSYPVVQSFRTPSSTLFRARHRAIDAMMLTRLVPLRHPSMSLINGWRTWYLEEQGSRCSLITRGVKLQVITALIPPDVQSKDKDIVVYQVYQVSVYPLQTWICPSHWTDSPVSSRETTHK